MALETWLVKVKKTIAQRLDSARATPPTQKRLPTKKSNVAVLAFEIAGLMSKLLHLWQSLSDKNIARLRADSICLEGVRKIVSNDDAFLLGLACAELVENLKSVAKSISRISKNCEDPSLGSFDRLLLEFVNSGHDPNNWLLGPKEIEPKFKKMDQLVLTTATLHREMDELVALESALKKSLQSKKEEQKLIELQHKILWQRQEIKYLKDKSLWSRSFDSVTLLLVRSVFTILSRIKLVFGVGHGFPITLPRSLSSSSALVYPSENPGPMKSPLSLDGFFESNSKILKPPPSTLGAVALSLHYSNLVIVMEKMIRSPQLVGVDARDDLYSMLPNSIRFALRARLKGVGFSASDPVLAAEWRDALQKILGWLAPLAHNMIKWQSERSFEQQNMVPKTNVLLLQTLYFANQEKTEAAITELLVGLNYIWRFEREMNAKAIFQCSNFNGYLSSQYPS
ncbi:hypothetical protein PHJA_000974500 [Phtheirospermum japonicum]|uniref:Uncharacterized protein n=1 Tax=Phtheirospermum japonicum TaxID=374723 RepID=A0A830BTP7_9LAMI|nr:hypothetical protein PHJA_000974500 [Phtheirospermum japonicum]